MKEYCEETREKVDKLRLIDDVLFRQVVARKKVCQEILRTLLSDSKLEVKWVHKQEHMVSFYREIWLDALCKLEDGRYVNVEVQKGNKNDDRHRVRFHQAAITSSKTPKGTKFAKVPDVIVIYITDYDALETGQTITLCETCVKYGDNYTPINDGAKTYFVNTVIDDGSAIAELMQLFLTSEAFNDDRYPVLSKTMNYYKNDRKGRDKMCQIVEDYAKDYADKQMLKTAKRMIVRNYSNEDINDITELPISKIKKLRSKMEKN